MQAVATLHASALASVHDVTCRCGRGAFGPEEEGRGAELVLPRAGLFVRRARGRDVVADPNRALFFRPGEPYRVSHPVGGGDRCTVIGLPRRRLAELARDLGLPEDEPFARPAVPTAPASDLLHRRLLGALRAVPRGADGLAADELVLALAAHLLARAAQREDAAAPLPLSQRELVDAARRALAERLGARLALADLARTLGASPYHLSRVFRRGTGLTLSRYHRRLRLRAALEHLAGGERDLTALALELGFAHHSHFTNAFRAELGRPPSALRRRADARELRALAARLPRP